MDSTVPVGARLATIGSASAPKAAAPVVAPPAPPKPAPVAPAQVRAVPTPPQTPPPLVPKPSALDDSYVTPIVRKLANESGVDLSKVKGTGVGGRIRKEDVLAAIPSKAATPAPAAPNRESAPSAPAKTAPASPSPLRGTQVKMSRLRKVIAARMIESLQVSAQLTTVVEVDITKISRLRDKAKASFEAREGVKLSFLPFFAVAVCEALKVHPVLNSSVEGDVITYHGAEHLGIAVDTERGLLVPVIRDAGDLNMGGIARRIAEVAQRTRDNKIAPDELGGGTFTLTNTRFARCAI